MRNEQMSSAKRWLLAVSIGLLTGGVWAQTAPKPGAVGEVAFSRGVGFAQTPGQLPRTLGQGLPLVEGDRLSTAAGATAIVKLNDGTKMTLRPQTEVVLDRYQYKADATDNNMVLNLLRGGFRAITGLINKNSPNSASVRSPTATLGIRGTDFDVRLCGRECAPEASGLAAQASTINLKASAKAVAVKGAISVVDGKGERRQVVNGSSVYPGDLVETEAQAQAVLAFRDESRVTLGSSTRFRVDDFTYDSARPSEGQFLVSLLRGSVRALTGLIGKSNQKAVRLKTPTATLGIRGTGFDVSCDDDNCSFFNWLGSIVVTPEGHSALQVLEEGQGLLVTRTGIQILRELPMPDLPRPDGIELDRGPLFSASTLDESAEGLYVLVRDGHIELFSSQGTLHLGRGEVGFADPGGRVLRPLQMPRFLEFDTTPLPGNPNPLLATILGESSIRFLDQCR